MNANDLNVFVPDCGIEPAGLREGPLAGRTFGLKDMFDLAGVPTGAGNPDWRRTHAVPTRTAPAAAMILDAGAELVGKTITDELAWDLDGRNCHYGTPVNVAAPGRLPGGSSSGSAAATAAGLCDFAIGTDTGGSVRLPASFCGVYGMRPTHGRITDEGVVPLAPSFDTVGWFARDPQLLRTVAGVLFGGRQDGVPTERLLIAEDLFALASPEAREALRPWLERLAGSVGASERVTVAGERASAWRDAFRTLQSFEAWAEHREWIDRVDPDFGTDIEEHLKAAAELDSDTVERARATRAEARERMEALLSPGTLLILPTVPGIAPRLDVPEDEHDAFRDRAHAMLCVGGLTGMPQVAMPVARVDGCPLGLSALGTHGQDEAVLDLAVRLADAG